MDTYQIRSVRSAFIGCCLLVVSHTFADGQQAAPTKPDFAAVQQAVDAHFATIDHYRPGDLISRSDITAALQKVRSAGWEVPNQQAIVELGLADNSFLVRRLSTTAGRKFMRKVATMPGGYARLDRLSTINKGQALIDDLIRTKGGYELIEYMATSKEGHRLGEQMAATPGGVDLNQPTGRLYTADELLAVLERAWLAN